MGKEEMSSHSDQGYGSNCPLIVTRVMAHIVLAAHFLISSLKSWHSNYLA